MKIYCDNVEIDVTTEYKNRGFSELPSTITMPAYEILCASKAPANRGLWHGNRKIENNESVILSDGMKFLSVPPATY